MKIILLAFFMSSTSYAALDLPSFPLKEARNSPIVDETNVIFVDFQSAQYKTRFAADAKSMQVSSKILFTQAEAGHVAFDFSATVKNLQISLDQKTTSMVSILPPVFEDHSPQQNLQILTDISSPGDHILTITYEVEFYDYRYSLQMTDNQPGKDVPIRYTLGRYFPTNVEQDQYEMNLDMDAAAISTELALQSNAEIKSFKKNYWQLYFPKHFNSMAPFLKMDAKKELLFAEENFKSLSGKTVPIRCFNFYKTDNTENNKFWMEQLKECAQKSNHILKKYESMFGAYANPRLLIEYHGNDSDEEWGMEYIGAAQSFLGTLEHEIGHMFFARGVLSKNGNSGWIDEGMVYWLVRYLNGRESKDINELSQTSSQGLANMSPYEAYTPNQAPNVGQIFIGHLALRLKERNLSFIQFLKFWYSKYLFQPVSTEVLENEIETFSQIDFSPEFNKYIYAK